MADHATISFSQAGVHAPVYVVTSLSNPPWETLEMTASGERTPEGDVIFTRQFEHPTEGSHQYKIRIGEGHWVVDESKESATDEQGNRNNVTRVEKSPVITRKDSTVDVSALSPPADVPVPFVVVEKVPDQEQPEIGDIEPQSLPHDAAKRTADAEPDFEEVVSPDNHAEPHVEDEKAAPPVQHEAPQAEEPPLESPSMDRMDEVSVQSSTDQTSSGDVVNTPSEADGSEGKDELNHVPLFSHETGFGTKHAELDRALQFSQERDLDDEDDGDELNNAPLLPHETGFADENELDNAPLLPHETGFSQYKGSDVVSEYSEDDKEPRRRVHYDDEGSAGRNFDADRAPAFSHEVSHDDYAVDDAPLLPHERGMARTSFSGSNISDDDRRSSFGSQPTFGYETAGAKEVFGGLGENRRSVFRPRTNSSTLPHQMPKSDEEDDDLRDSSLEAFPTAREQIFERVATISHHLQEDQGFDDPHSPESVMSQACSSVDLRPVLSHISLPSVLSHISLPSVQEVDDDNEEEEVDDIPSPVMMGGPHTRVPNFFPGFARDPNATPMSEDNKRLELVGDDKNRSHISHTSESSETDSVGRNDGAKDFPASLAQVVDTIATPLKALNPLTSPNTSQEKAATTGKDNGASVSGPELRQRRALEEDDVKASSTTPAASDGAEESISDKISHAITPAAPQKFDQPKKSFFQNFVRAVSGSANYFLTTCLGDRKRASASVVVVGVAAAAYYYSTAVA